MAKAPIEIVQMVLFTALAALKEYLGDIVVVGGWVPKIYAWSEDLAEPPVHSFDVDAAVGGAVPEKDRKSITELLEAAGFDTEQTDAAFGLGAFGSKSGHITRFVYKKDSLRVIFEFIAPLVGRGESERKTIQGGLVAPALRFVDVLLADTQEVSIQGEKLNGKRTRLKFRVPTLAAFVYAKGLVFPRRDSIDKKGKDLAYIYEVLSRPKWRDAVLRELPAVAKKHPANWYRTFRRSLEEHFETEGAAGPAWVALQYPGRKPDDMRREALAFFRQFLADIPASIA